jgi:ligand-binding sensor domain-containing protein/signal transduction histidine kinase
MKYPFGSHWIFLVLIACLSVHLLTSCSLPRGEIPPFSFSSVHEESPLARASIPAINFFAEDIPFVNITVENGLSQTTVECIYQDSQGFLWFCTHEGIDRFDGYEFVNFNHDPQDINSIRENVAYAISEDRNGNMWFGTQTGLDRYNPENGDFLHFNLSHQKEGAFDDVRVNSLLLDQNGDLWAGSAQGVFRIKITSDQTLKTTYFALLDIVGTTVKGNPVGTIFQDSQGAIWAGTQEGLSRYDSATDSFDWMLKPSPTDHSLTQAIAEIEPDMLLIGGEYGLFLYNARSNTTSTIKDDRILSSSSKLEMDTVQSMIQDQAGMFWIGTSTGLIGIDPRSNTGAFLPQLQENSNSQKTILSVFQDREGNIWIGTLDQGLYVYQPLQRKFTGPDSYILDTIQQGNIWTLFVDHQGFLWVGTDYGLLRINRHEQEIHFYSFQSIGSDDQTNQLVRAMIEDPDGNLWSGTTEGYIYIYDRENDSFIREFKGSVQSGAQINLFYIDHEGDLWIGTNHGLYWYQPDRDMFHHFVSDPLNPDSLSHDRIDAIQEDEAGNLWIGTRDGLNHFDKEKLLFSKIIFSAQDDGSTIDNAILAILPDSEGGLWLGSRSGGLHHYQVPTGELTHYRNPEGITDGMIFSILQDRQRNLWISTQRGLSKFNPDQGLFTNYSYEDGLPSNEFNLGASFQSEQGEIFLGGINGFISFFPEDILQNSYLPPIVLTEITQSGEEIASERPFDHLKALSLTWPNNFFEFEFAALSYAQPEDNLYAYYLEGIDPDWVYAGKTHNGRYVNLPGGRYTLHLIGSNNDGVWNSTGSEIQINVTPPLWQRLWFQFVLFSCLVTISYAGYRYRVRSIVTRSNELERLVDERTSDLSEINKQLVEEIAEREKAEQRLAQRIASEAILTERNRLARDLHDAVTQTIFSASILSETLPHTLEVNPEKGRQQIEELQQLTRGALAELRSLLIELRPEGLVKTDLKDLLAQLCKGVTGRSGIPVELNCDTRAEIPSEIKITLYRIAQEALNNASRHANPSHIEVHCSSDQEFVKLSIRDDGKGFDHTGQLESRLGLGIMQERAADIGAGFDVISRPGCGTTISIEWIFPKNGDSDE